jgi:hypothetical protein
MQIFKLSERFLGIQKLTVTANVAKPFQKYPKNRFQITTSGGFTTAGSGGAARGPKYMYVVKGVQYLHLTR